MSKTWEHSEQSGERFAAFCEYCNGTLIEKPVTVYHRWKGQLTIVENVPARVCQQCGERYYAAAVLEEIERLAREDRKPARILTVPVQVYGQASA